MSFYALGVGLGLATASLREYWASEQVVSMPSVSGWALRRSRTSVMATGCGLRFYALGVGLGFATSQPGKTVLTLSTFLCPRCRAGLCDGCRLTVPVTCIFAYCCASRAGKGRRDARFSPRPGRRAADRGLLVRQPRQKVAFPRRAVPGHPGAACSAARAARPRRIWWSRRSRGWSGRRCRCTRRNARGPRTVLATAEASLARPIVSQPVNPACSLPWPLSRRATRGR